MEGAQVYALFAGGATQKRLGITDSDGRLAIHLAREESPFEFLAVHEAGMGWTRLLEPLQIRIRLASSDSLEGSVIDTAGSSAKEVIVLAVPRSLHELVMGSTAADCLSNPEVHATRTGADGHFALQVPQGREYCLVAGGSGFVQVHPPPFARPGVEDVVITVGYLYAVDVSFTDESGKSIDAPRVAGAGFGIRMHPVDPKFRFVAGGAVSASLTLLEASPPEERFELTCLLVADYPDPQGTRIDVSGSLPGYEPFHCFVDALPIREGCPDATIVLASRGQTGVVRIQLEPCSQARADSLKQATGVLYLAGPSETLQLGVVFEEACVGWTTHVPYGDYQATLQIDPEGVFDSPETSLLVSRPINDLTVDVGATGSLLVVSTAADSDGLAGPYGRGLRLFIGQGDMSPATNGELSSLAGASVGFTSGPYTVPVIRAGSYTLLVQHPRLLDPGAKNFTIAEGTTTQVSLTLKE